MAAGPRWASPCALFWLWSRRGQAGCSGPPALRFRVQPSEWFHRPRPVSKSVDMWWPRAGSGAQATPGPWPPRWCRGCRPCGSTSRWTREQPHPQKGRPGCRAAEPGSLQVGPSSSELSPQSSSWSHSCWASTQALFWQWCCPRGQRAWGSGEAGGQLITPAQDPGCRGSWGRGSSPSKPGASRQEAPAVPLPARCVPIAWGLTGQPTAREGHVVQRHSAPVGGISGGREGHLERAVSLGPKSGLSPSLLPHCPEPPSPGSHPGFGR